LIFVKGNVYFFENFLKILKGKNNKVCCLYFEFVEWPLNAVLSTHELYNKMYWNDLFGIFKSLDTNPNNWERKERERERQKEIEECRRWDESIYGKFKMNSKRKLGYITLILRGDLKYMLGWCVQSVTPPFPVVLSCLCVCLCVLCHV
jgi:hypothetical protein